MNLRRLQYFVKIVDIGSLTQAADILHVAQPALSQQLATLEGEVHQQLLVRTKRGVTPTEAGRVLYRHAQLILRQCEQARVDMIAASHGLSGAVSVGLAPGTAAAGLALPLLRAVRARHPGILLYLNETYGNTLSEFVMNGRMDLAVLYGGRNAVHGLTFLPLLQEQLFVVVPESMMAPPEQVPLRMVGDMDLCLARPYNVVRKMVDEAFAGAGMTPRVVAEIEFGGNARRRDRRRTGRDDPAAIHGTPDRRGLQRLAVPDRRAGDRGAVGALPVGLPAACPNRHRRSARSCWNWSAACPATCWRRRRVPRPPRHKAPLSRQSHSLLVPFARTDSLGAVDARVHVGRGRGGVHGP